MKRIKEIAKLIGVHPTTIRLWEKKGLVVLNRSFSGQRVFDESTINRLKELAGLKGG
jgi:DNA-binding transcriptional MerR regulator